MYTVSPKNVFFYFWNNSVKNKDISIIFGADSWGNLTLADYKVTHFALKMSPHYLVKCKKVDLRQQLVETWREFSRAWWIIDQWRTRLDTCVQADSGHFEQRMW